MQTPSAVDLAFASASPLTIIANVKSTTATRIVYLLVSFSNIRKRAEARRCKAWDTSIATDYRITRYRAHLEVIVNRLLICSGAAASAHRMESPVTSPSLKRDQQRPVRRECCRLIVDIGC